MQTKICGKCGKRKRLKEFYSKGTGLRWECKICTNILAKKWAVKNRKKITARHRKSRRANPALARDMKRYYRYKLPVGEYEKRVKEQKGRCCICQIKAKLVVDHCHDKKIFRGLLCHRCNTGIGFLQHDPEIIRAALKYLSDG